MTATPTDGSEAVIGQATSEPNTAVVTLTLDPTKQYAVDYTGINATGEGADVALHGVKFTVTASEPQEHRKWDFTAWSQETKDNLEAEFQAAGYTTAPAPEGTETGWRRYEKDGAAWTETDGLKDAGTIYWYGSYISEPTELKANGVTIAETKGLKFNNVTKLNNTLRHSHRLSRDEHRHIRRRLLHLAQRRRPADNHPRSSSRTGSHDGR